MKKWIRWQGLGAFVIVMIIVFGFWYLFIDGIIERAIEKQATQAVGAKVELESADLTLFPAGLNVSHLQLTNPDDPMKNAVEISRINLSLEVAHLLHRKIIIKEVVLDGIQLNTPRKTSGALVSRAPAPPVLKKEQKKRASGKNHLTCLVSPRCNGDPQARGTGVSEAGKIASRRYPKSQRHMANAP